MHQDTTAKSSSKTPRKLSLDSTHRIPYGSIEEALRLSKGNFAYIAGRDGLFKATKIGDPDGPAEYTIVTSIDKAPSLRDVKTGFFIRRIAPVPFSLISEAADLFRTVFERHGSEMIAILRWDHKHKEYFLDRAKFGVIGPGYLRYYFEGARTGTIHSHGNMDAFFSSTDDGDDCDKPGIHFVLGDIDRKKPSIAVSITGAGLRHEFKGQEPGNWNPWSHKVSAKKYAWFMENILTTEEVESKTRGFYILEKKTRQIAFWTKTRKEAKSLINECFEITEIEKKESLFGYPQQRAFKGHTDWGQNWGRATERKTIDISATKHLSSDKEESLRNFVEYIITLDLYEEFAEIFAEIASEHEADRMLEALDTSLTFCRTEDSMFSDQGFENTAEEDRWKYV